MDTDKLETAWLVIYQSLIAMHHHPGHKEAANAKKLAELADYYTTEFLRRFTCLHSSPEPLSPAAPPSAAVYSAAPHSKAPTKQTSDYNENNEHGKNK